MYRHVALASSLLALLIASEPEAQAQSSGSFVTAVGAAGSESFAFGTEFWALSQIELLPKHQISVETVEIPNETDRLIRLREGRSHFALMRNDVPTSFAHHTRAVMALWPNGIEEVGVEPTQLLVRADVSEDTVYRVTRTIFEHAAKLSSAHATMGIGSTREAMDGLSVPIHPGAYRYYDEQGLGRDHASTLASRRPEIATRHGAIDRAGLRADEAQQLAAACRHAAAQNVLDHIDGDDWAEVCGARGAYHMIVGPAGGQGGPWLAAHEGGQQVKSLRGNSRSTMPGQQPTM